MKLIDDVPQLQPTPLAYKISTQVKQFRGIEGGIGYHDALFLVSLLEITNAYRVVEIGVASGASSTWILNLLTAKTRQKSGVLFAFDLAKHYYADQSKKLGYLAFESGLATSENFRISGGKTSIDVSEIIKACEKEVDAVFIDAQHCHPFPSLDMLSVISVVKPGGWIIHHDINLNVLLETNVSRGHHIIFNKSRSYKLVDSGDVASIGAIKLSENLSDDVEDIFESLRDPWEYSPSAQDLSGYLKAAKSWLPQDQYYEFIRIVKEMSVFGGELAP